MVFCYLFIVEESGMDAFIRKVALLEVIQYIMKCTIGKQYSCIKFFVRFRQ